MGRCWLVLGGTGPVLGSPGWFVVVMGQYGAVLVGTWWYWVSALLDIKWNWISTTLLCLYILKKVEIWSGVT